MLAEQGRPGRKAAHGQLRIRGAGEVSYSEIAAPTLPPLTLGRDRRPRRRLGIGIAPRPRGPHVTLGRVPGRAPPRKRVSHTGMVEDRIGSKTSLEVPFWWKSLFGGSPFLVGRPIPVTLILQTALPPALKSFRPARSTDALPYTTGVLLKSRLWANRGSVHLTFSFIRALSRY